ncbi:MAG: SDR family oxidoreductase, partial [Betaproteobacteria bacterium]
MRIAVTGARGQLGTAIVRELSRAHDVSALDHGALDIADDRAVHDVMARLRPGAIVNCAAYTDVDGAEDHPVEALNANAFAVRALARAAAEQGAALVHYSTDFVFDGAASRPYTEDDPPNPRSTYAASKLFGEWFAADAPRAYVLRVESLFGAADGPPRGSVAGIVARLVAGQEVRAFADRTVSPTSVVDAAAATRALLERELPGGVYHCVSSGHCTWYEFA